MCRQEQGTLLTDIHRAFGYSMATLSGMVKRLREKGYIRVERCEEDDRRRLLFATEKARQLWPDLEETIQGVHSRLYDGFSQEELSALDHLQGKLLQNLSALTAQSQKEESKS
ncbi:MarR family transcriptional regulator [Pseudoflavonifractor sp. CLA-AP-H29]|uniref:MarR family transcriptional regulator n=1 Tax=Pseudoflavonifractor intestinihominis TaxID=3133171 RepID=A0ABV1E9Q6_9FIRM